MNKWLRFPLVAPYSLPSALPIKPGWRFHLRDFIQRRVSQVAQVDPHLLHHRVIVAGFPLC